VGLWAMHRPAPSPYKPRMKEAFLNPGQRMVLPIGRDYQFSRNAGCATWHHVSLYSYKLQTGVSSGDGRSGGRARST